MEVTPILVTISLLLTVIVIYLISRQNLRPEPQEDSALKFMPIPAFVLDSDFRLLDFNADFEKLTEGVKPMGRLLYEVFRDHKVIDALDECRRQGQSTTYFYPKPTVESPRSYRLRLCQQGDKYYGVIETCLQQEKQEDVELYQKMLHELRTPLSAVRLMAESLAEEDDPQERKNLVLKIIEEMDRLNHLASDLALLVKMERGLVNRMDKVNLVSLTSEVVWQMSMLSESKKVMIELMLPDTAVYVAGSKSLLKSLLLNLLDNAVKYSPEGAKVTVQLREEDERVIISVADEGEGIPPAEAEKVLQKFYRATTKADGLGLGLAIASEVVKFHDGRLWLEQNEPKGLKVFVALRKA